VRERQGEREIEEKKDRVCVCARVCVRERKRIIGTLLPPSVITRDTCVFMCVCARERGTEKRQEHGRETERVRVRARVCVCVWEIG